MKTCIRYSRTERGKPHHPVRFANDGGIYQPGALATAERAKLPPDAIAIVQQLLLWYPTDSRLYWLLGETLCGHRTIRTRPRDHGFVRVRSETIR